MTKYDDSHAYGNRGRFIWTAKKLSDALDTFNWVDNISNSHVSMGIAGDLGPKKNMAARRKSVPLHAGISDPKQKESLVFKDWHPPLVYPNKKMKSMKGSSYVNATNQLAGKASMKKSGKIKNVKKGKTVKVSKSLRAKVKEVMSDACYSGSYHATTLGTIGTAMVDADLLSNAVYNQDPANFAGANANVIRGVPRYQDSRTATWTYWAGLNERDLGTVQTYDHMMEHFSPLQFLDAASKLWNCKYGTSNSWYTHSDGNIQLNVVRSSGENNNVTAVKAPAVVGDLKLKIVNSYVKYSLRNTSARQMTVEFYHCTPKLKFPGTNALTDLWNACNAELLGVDGDGLTPTTNPKLSLFQTHDSTSGSAGSVAALLGQTTFDPKDSVQFRSRWNYQKVTLIIGPGETCEHSIQGPKNCVLDFSKIVQQTINSTPATTARYIPCWVKGFTTSVFCRVLPSMVTSSDLGSPGSKLQYNGAGTWDTSEGADLKNAKVCLPIAVKMDYDYHLKCPEQAGYLAAAVAAGSARYLNLKRRSIRYDNYSQDPGVVGYFNNNEENPNSFVGASYLQ